MSSIDIEIYSYGIPIVLCLIFAEVIYSTVKGLGYYKLKDSLAGYGLLAGNILINFSTKGSILFFYIYLYQFKLFTVNEILSPILVWVLTFVTIDFIYYWYHRCSHRVRFLWAVHMNHHSSEEMNFSVALRYTDGVSTSNSLPASNVKSVSVVNPIPPPPNIYVPASLLLRTNRLDVNNI